jgi:RNA polymerase sigma-70 factor (family 1)
LDKEPLHNEKELLIQISEGDQTAFGHLFEWYYGKIYSASIRYLKVHELAEDIVQTSFLKIWDKRDTLKNVERFDDYLFRIARNEMTSHFRKNIIHEKHRKRIVELFEEESGTPEDLLIVKQKRALIADLINSLPPQQKQAYRLSRDKGMNYEQIAEEMKLSVNTIKVHISLALKTLRAFFAQHKNDFYFLLLVWALTGV